MTPLWLISQKNFVDVLASITNQKQRKKYYDVSLAYDSEASSFTDDSGNRVGLVYLWGLGLFYDGVKYVTTGRSIWEFVETIELIKESCRHDIVIYVHNLQYDISFFYKCFEFDKMFLVKSRKVAYARYGHIVFRDSLLLAGGRSLNTVGKELIKYKEKKLVGALDYSKIRTPVTKLTERELQYQINDVSVLLSYIQEKIETDGGISGIPLTNTGYVRKALRDSCGMDYENHYGLIDKLVLPPRAYWVLKRAEAGGFVHGAEKHVGITLENVGSYDIKSSYPGVILTEYFPMSQPSMVETKYANEHLEELCSQYCVTFVAEISGVVTTQGNEYILSESKIVLLGKTPEERKKEFNDMNVFTFNGRIICAKWIRYAFTELDWDSFKKFYNYDSVKVSDCWYYKRGRLPKTIVRPMLDWFAKKTTLDGVSGAEIEYMISKNMLNAIAGCMEMDPVRERFEYDYENREFLPGQKPDIISAVDEENNNNKRFLFFPWGVWILAQARHKLLDVVAHTGADHVYSDTDSEKLLNYERYEQYFKDLNKTFVQKVLDAGKFYGIDRDILIPRKPNGKEAILGVFEFEGVYRRFKTLGAKRYLVEKKDGTYALTVAGVNKRTAMEYMAGATLDHIDDDNRRILKPCHHDTTYSDDELSEVGQLTATRDPFEVFKLGMTVPAERAGRLSMEYIDERRTGEVTDYQGRKYKYDIPCGVNARNVGFKLRITQEEEDMDKAFMILAGGRYEGGGV